MFRIKMHAMKGKYDVAHGAVSYARNLHTNLKKLRNKTNEITFFIKKYQTTELLEPSCVNRIVM